MRVIELLFVLWVFSASLAVEGRHASGLANQGQGGDADPGNMYYSDGFCYYSLIPGTPFYYPMPIPGLVLNQQMIPPFKLPWNPLPRISQSPSPPTASSPPPIPNTVAPLPEGSPSPPIDRSREFWGETSSSTSCSNHICCTTIVYTGTDCSTGKPRSYRKVEQRCSPRTGP